MPATHHGSVVVTSSTAGLKGSANTSAYVASKHAALGLARVAAAEGAARGIRVNAIHPTAVRGGMIKRIADDLDRRGGTQPALDRIASGILLGRLVEPEDVAATVVYLASDDSRMVTGASIVVASARPAIGLAASALPALKPNQPNQRSPAPSSTVGMLCGRIDAWP